MMLRLSPDLVCEQVYATAEEAMEDLLRHPVDVVLTDIHLPGNSGIECVRYLRPLCPQIQFLMWTSYEDSESVFRALQAGANGYLTKTTQAAKVVEAIADIHYGGSPMSSQIARMVVSSFTPQRQHDQLEKLTAREQEILQHLTRGLRYKEIADLLHVSTETVRTHIRNIYEKLQVNSRTEALNKVYPR